MHLHNEQTKIKDHSLVNKAQFISREKERNIKKRNQTYGAKWVLQS